MTENKIELLRQWLLEANPELTGVADDEDIIDSRILSSLQFVEFILYVERIRGAAIDFDELDIDAVRTLRDIEQNYLTPSESGSPATSRETGGAT